TAPMMGLMFISLGRRVSRLDAVVSKKFQRVFKDLGGKTHFPAARPPSPLSYVLTLCGPTTCGFGMRVSEKQLLCQSILDVLSRVGLRDLEVGDRAWEDLRGDQERKLRRRGPDV